MSSEITKVFWTPPLPTSSVKQVNGPGVVNGLLKAFEKRAFCKLSVDACPVVDEASRLQILPKTVAVFCNQSTSSRAEERSSFLRSSFASHLSGLRKALAT